MTKIHLLFQIFDYNHDGLLSRSELLLLLRSSVSGVRKLCGFAVLSTNIFEQLVSHAFATSSSAAQQKEAGMTFAELCSWARMNEDVKVFLAAASPAAIHSAQRQRRKSVHKVNISHNSKTGGVQSNKNQDDTIPEGRRSSGHATTYKSYQSAAQQQRSFHLAVEAHRKHCLTHLADCKAMKTLFDSMDKSHNNRVTLGDFTESLPSALKASAGDMFRALTAGKYLTFAQMLHEMFPTMTHEEIEMLSAATRRHKKKSTRKVRVKLTTEQTEEMYALFDMYNTDHSGHMSVAELTAAMTATGAFTVKECQHYFDLADHAHHHSLSKADFVHFFQDSFTADVKPLFRVHPDDLTPLENIPHEHQHLLL